MVTRPIRVAAPPNTPSLMPKSPQTNGICERFYRTVLDEFDRVAFRKEIYRTINERQTGLDAWITEYNEQRPHQGRWCFGKTPMQTFLERATTGQGKTHGSMTTDDSHIGSNNQHRQPPKSLPRAPATRVKS